MLRFCKHTHFTLDKSGFKNKSEAMCDAILGKSANKENPSVPWLIENGFILCENNKLSANFLVFDHDVFEKVGFILSGIAEQVASCMIEISDKAEKLLAQHTPEHLRKQCGDIARIHHRIDVMAFLLESLIDSRKLTLPSPSERVPLCVFGVRNS